MLKEPVSESLLCLCALGLVHNDTTLATAALAELLKQGSSSGSIIEQRCLLTCTLLALQGNYSAVQREASRAVHRLAEQRTQSFAGMFEAQNVTEPW